MIAAAVFAGACLAAAAWVEWDHRRFARRTEPRRGSRLD